MSANMRACNEGYVLTGDGDLVPTQVIHAPWLSTLQANGEDAPSCSSQNLAQLKSQERR
jgi:hypothetical protein